MINGQWTTGTFSGHETKDNTITFDRPLDDTNYGVSIVMSNMVGGGGWADICMRIREKTVNGFTIVAYNANTSAVNSATIDWSVIY